MLMGKDVMAGFLRAVSMTIAPFDRDRGKAEPRGCHRRVVHDPAADRRSGRCGTPHPPPTSPACGGGRWGSVLVYLKKGGRGMTASSSSIRRLYSGSRWRHNPPAWPGSRVHAQRDI